MTEKELRRRKAVRNTIPVLHWRNVCFVPFLALGAERLRGRNVFRATMGARKVVAMDLLTLLVIVLLVVLLLGGVGYGRGRWR